jgi:beta-glucosidase
MNAWQRLSRSYHRSMHGPILCTPALILAAGLLTGSALAQKPAGPWRDRHLTPDQRADLVIAQMTLQEKISRLHGGGWGFLFAGPDSPPTKSLGGAGFIPGIPRLGIPDLQMADAAVGVTRGALYGRYSTALPSCVAEAASWDLDIAREYGALIGRELRDQGYNMSLGGGVNLTREPRNGRTFEYRGEDPVLAGKMAGAEMKALQQEGVIGDIKHFAMNDQESGRSFVNVRVGRRAMRESDLLAFEIAIHDSGAGAVMCSYNLVNGDYACENRYLLTQVLKKDFGFRGFVVSDWGGTHSTVKAALAGLDMEMPTNHYFAAALAKAVDSGQVPLSRLNDMVHRILRTEFAIGLFDKPPDRRAPDIFHGLEVAQQVEEQGAVLLKNAQGQLPLAAAQIRSIAVIGSHADVGVLSGGGSAQVDPAGGNAVPEPPGVGIFDRVVWHRSSPLRAIRARMAAARVEYDGGSDPAAAARLAKTAEVAIVFLNQPMGEAKDAPNLSLPGHQDALVRAVAAANPHTIVVLETGGPVTMPWIDQVSAVLEAWYPGIRGGEAIARILFGEVNPSGKLPLTFARSEADLAHPQLMSQPAPGPGELRQTVLGSKENTRRFDIDYHEGAEVGYKWFDAEHKEPLFAFGYGLSYTSFAYSDLHVTGGQAPAVSFEVKNTGRRQGAEIAEVYVTLPVAANEPYKRLEAWEKVDLAPGESKTVTLTMNPRYLSIFEGGWQFLPGEYEVQVGGSSRDLPLKGAFRISGAP